MREAHSNSYSNFNTGSNSDCYSNRDGDRYFHAQSNADAEGSTNTTAAAHPRTAPVACLVIRTAAERCPYQAETI